MNKVIRYLILSFGIWLPCHSYAQSLVTLPTGDVACSIAIKFHGFEIPKDADGKEQPEKLGSMLRSAQIVGNRQLHFFTVERTDGKNSRVWCPLPLNYTFFKDSAAPKMNSTRGNNLYPAVFYLSQNPIWYSWATLENFKEEDSLNGVACKRYESLVRIPSPSPQFPDGYATYQLWVNNKTLLPVAFDDGEAFYTLTFGEPYAPPSLPAEALKEADRYAELLAPSKPSR